MSAATEALALLRAGDRSEAMLVMQAAAETEPQLLAPLALMWPSQHGPWDDYATTLLEVMVETEVTHVRERRRMVAA